jgi:sortase A
LKLQAEIMEMPGARGSPHKRRILAQRLVILSERLLLVAGVLLLLFVAAAYLHRSVMVRIEMWDFEKAKTEALANDAPVKGAPSPEKPEPSPTSLLDQQLPAESTVARPHVWPARHDNGVPLAILRIPRIHLEVPVLTGTDEITLNRGVGQIAGTAPPGEQGNIGIAGHRDGFFRNLKEISRGDEIDLETTGSAETYVVDRVMVTGPDDTSVLEPSDQPMLTLVTCYPFHYIGPAPRRFVVQAHLKR